MSYRRKVSSIIQLSTLRQLQLMCNAEAMSLPFQVHNAQALLEQLKVYHPAKYEQFSKNPTTQEFVPSRVISNADGGSVTKGAPIFTLPLPKHFINPTDSAEDIIPRTFYHSSVARVVADPDAECYLPRCGLTGLFFSREEVVDNLQAAAAELHFRSPFWIRTDHPALGDFLTLKDDSEAICISLTAAVISIEDVEPFPVDLLHPKLKQALALGKHAFSEQIPPGMNALSGFVTKNPFVQSLPNGGVWLSHKQVLQHSFQIKKKSSAGESPFVLAEIEQWELHNADQLSVPGRLALNHNANNSKRTSVFT
ncbi:hypothetical protein, conserved [Trypanosoma brucei gambiense DAL972]|uniref:Trypanosoma Tc-38 (p38) protein domain-containing protein n=2 Tax=Trypanosoma brucei TaxID=5691 RepID=D0A2E5_TRYB9|nr:hypothetical protein, conserved [Trypanosoma brucei gambiense DAL972]RHW69857.1 hypothetical protein DPX39_100048000 [Trypanosoma brucei equiperdum]CBH15439.1 hypothetical protein, conserved [Trypanosoma brucei gambiense DAL972]|eukprot:XP_011777703.1 hypothetical protein, conserved [Trypanosoma brucei gambiense DAL972]